MPKSILAFVQNPNQNGHVLLLAGAKGEGTQAAGELAADLPHISPVLQKCGVTLSGPLQHFEILMHLNAMADTPINFDVVACHILPDTSSRYKLGP
jgi:hypothetical protein